MGGVGGAAWHVLTFDCDIGKVMAVKISNQYLQWLARYMGRVFSIKAEWVKVWEKHRSGRLHLNIIMSPWRFISQKVLSQKWHGFGGGVRMWIERVGTGIGNEAAKSRNRIGRYFAKNDQMVLTGRGVSCSKGWPGLPLLPKAPRLGEIDWRFVGSFSVEGRLHWYDTEMGAWHEVLAGEWASFEPEPCGCFGFRPSMARKARNVMRAIKALKNDREGVKLWQGLRSRWRGPLRS